MKHLTYDDMTHEPAVSIIEEGNELKRLEFSETFTDVKDLRVTLMSVVDCLPGGFFSLGYKGRQINLDSNDDLLLMYKVHEKRRQNVLWMK